MSARRISITERIADLFPHGLGSLVLVDPNGAEVAVTPTRTPLKPIRAVRVSPPAKDLRRVK